jgi:hypothetical protein
LTATSADELREEVRRRYAESARAVTAGSQGCGTGSCCTDGEGDAANFDEALYDPEQRGQLPEAATLASLGCGNPSAVAELREGETVLDLGSGGGIDVILSGKRVGPSGTAYGLDRIGISDIVAEDRLSPEERADRGSYVGCIAGALSKGEYEAGLEAAGFVHISVEFTHQVADGMHSAIVTAAKTNEPQRKACR